jgi:TolA-binding protein
LKTTKKTAGLYIAILLLSGLAACSTKKNTWTSRAYHNVNAEFNVKFNATESFKAGVKKADAYLPQEYDRMPPVFAYTYKEIPGKVSGEMDRTIEKSEKLVMKHSITAKPNKKPSSQSSKKERDFYNQTEYNAVVDDAYLLNGKANMYLHQYDKAILLFEHILSEYPKSSAAPEAKIQLAGALIRTNETERAQRMLQESSKDKTLSKKLRALLDATYADLYIQQKNHHDAATFLEKALSQESKKANKIRYYFILSELYGETGRGQQAADMLNRAIALNPPYATVFNAQMRKAAFYNPATQGSKLREDLLNMLKDEKNEEFKDQIYFALAQVEKASGKDSLAMDYLNKAVALESSNDHQKALAYVLLGDYAYTHKKYADAYTGYNNALQLLDSDYAQYDSLEKKTDALRKLAESYYIVQREDSLQRIAQMPAAERDKWINDMIAKVVAEEEQQRQEQRQQQYFMYQDRGRTAMGQENIGSAWYFYNPSAVNSGISSFNMRWGRRKLEDDWRRKNKREVVSFSEQTADNTEDTDKAPSNKSKEYYTRDLPLTPEAMAASNERVSEALFKLGEAYKDDVHEPLSAIATFRTLDRRFPENNNRASAYYYLYELYAGESKTDSANHYKQLLINNYPKGPLAQQLTNPNYFAEQRAEKSAMEQQYERIFEIYTDHRYVEAGNLAQQMMQQYPNSLLQPQLEFIRAVSTGAGGNIAAYKRALSEVIKQYPTSDVAPVATEMIALLEKQELQYATASGSEPAAGEQPTASGDSTAVEYLFTTGAQYVGFICEQSQNTAGLLFALESYNADHHLDRNLEVAVQEIGRNYAIVFVRSFPALAAAQEYYSSIQTADVSADFPEQEFRPVIITPDNLERLVQSKDIAAYLHFFTLNYLK